MKSIQVLQKPYNLASLRQAINDTLEFKAIEA